MAERRTMMRKRSSSSSLSPLVGSSIPKEIVEKREKLWKIISEYQGLDKDSLIRSIAHHLEFTQFENRNTAVDYDIYASLSLAIRDRLIEFANDTQENVLLSKPKKVFYLSLEYLMGRSLRNNLVSLDLQDIAKEALEDIGYDLSEIEELEKEPGLGNGGLGRLAACFLDSMATLGLPAMGYGIRYLYGTFAQKIENGIQKEYPDNWLEKGNPWELPRSDRNYQVKFKGRVDTFKDESGRLHFSWVDAESVVARAVDVLIPGYRNKQVNFLRLWRSFASNEFNFEKFNDGSYSEAVADKMQSEIICKVLYPNDKTLNGKILRLKQQYFFVSASLQDLIREYKRDYGNDLTNISKKITIQLNDTHPSIAIPDFMRILMDENMMTWEKSWEITTEVFAYTNHTVLPEALERWPVSIFESLLPRHLDIIYEINRRFLEEVNHKFPGDVHLRKHMSLIEEGSEKMVRMSHLAIVGSHVVNGVAVLHSELLKATIFKDFYSFFPERFQNKTNGVTPRRWLLNANERLSNLIISKIGDSWITNLSDLKELLAFIDDQEFVDSWRDVKYRNKVRLSGFLKKHARIEFDPDSLLDVQVKRIHEYKRQLLSVLFCIDRYNKIKANPKGDFVSRTVLFGGKAAPGYVMAKLIIRLINDVAKVVNNDPATQEKLRIVFVENFGVSLGEKIYPAADISEQISTAGLEASGTGNMKFCMNGAMIVGTMDGANIEILEEVGKENIFIFGLTADQVLERRPKYHPKSILENHPTLQRILTQIREGFFSLEDPDRYKWIHDSLAFSDYYMVLADFDDYIRIQDEVDKAYVDDERWTRMSIRNTANMGKFSSDRSIQEYVDDIWEIEPIQKLHPETHQPSTTTQSQSN